MLALMEPRKAGVVLAQSKAAQAATVGKMPPTPPLFFLLICPERFRGKSEGKKEKIILGPQPRAPRRHSGLPWAIIISSLRDFDLARCARIIGCDAHQWRAARDVGLPTHVQSARPLCVIYSTSFTPTGIPGRRNWKGPASSDHRQMKSRNPGQAPR